MKFILSILIFLFLSQRLLFSQAPAIEWQRCLGSFNEEQAHSIQQTFDGGYIVAGIAYGDGDDVSGTIGNGDCWIVKLNAQGIIEWQKVYGGSNVEAYYDIDIRQTLDSGYIVATQTLSNNFDVSGNQGFYDCWLIKLNNSGDIEWKRCYGGTSWDEAFSVQQSKDEGYIFTGVTTSIDGDVSGNHGTLDFWVVKLYWNGDIQWQKCYGGYLNDFAFDIKQTKDQGYIIAGETNSNDGDVSGLHGVEDDIWLIKIDSIGNLQWQKCLGGTHWEYPYSVIQSLEGGFVVVGVATSLDGDVTGFHGGFNGDYWVVKLDIAGDIEWNKCLGGTDEDVAFDVVQTPDSGYIIVGYTWSTDGDSYQNHSDATDVLVVKLNANGQTLWKKCIGGDIDDICYSIALTSDGGFITAGWTTSNDGDVSGNHGNLDAWIVKFAGTLGTHDSPTFANTISVYPNPLTEASNIELSLEQFSFVTIDLMDITGRKLYGIKNESFATGIYNFLLDRNHLSSGLYFLQVTVNQEVSIQKIVVQ